LFFLSEDALDLEFTEKTLHNRLDNDRDWIKEGGYIRFHAFINIFYVNINKQCYNDYVYLIYREI